MTSSSPAPAAPPVRTLRRSRSNRIIGGVCGGLGRYLGVDPVLLRIAAVALALASGVGVIAYVIAWIAIPDSLDEPEPVRPSAAPAAMAVVAGASLVAVGGVLLVRQFVPWFEADIVWPVVVIVAGLLVLVTGLGRRDR
jgi:phage shock protein C